MLISRSNQSGGKIPSPVPNGKDNPAADLRNMRRIIAEDPEYSLARVPLLAELGIKHIVDNFECKYRYGFFEFFKDWIYSLYLHFS